MIRRREIMGVTAEHRVNAHVKERDQRGDTLIEVLLALMVLSLTAVALILAFSTSISGSADQRRMATANIVLASASQQAIAQIQSNSTLFMCPDATPPTTFVNNVSFSLATTGNSYLQGTNYGSFTPTISGVQYWNSTTGQFQDAQNDPTAPNNACIADVPMEVTVEVQLGKGLSPIFNTFVVNLPEGNLGTASNTSNTIASQLVFASNQTESASGEPGVAFSPQPVVSVLDATNQLDATDLSPIILSIENGPSGGSISGCSADDPSGQATFSGCVISGPAGTYVVQASVLGQSLISDPPPIGQDWNSVNAAGSFWQTSPNWYTTTFSVSVSGTPDQVTFAPAPVAQASGSLLTTQPVIDIINPSTGLPDTTKNGTVTLTLSGGQMVGCTNAAANVVTSSNDEVITATAVNGVVTLTGCTFSGAIFYNSVAYPPGKDPTTYTISASYSGAVTATSTIAVTGPGTAAQLEFVTEPGGVANASPTAALSPQPQVQIEDAFGNPEYNLTSATVNLAFASGGTVAETINAGTQSLGTNTGIVTFAGVAGSAFGGNLSLTATYSGLSVTSSPFSISPLGGETMVFSTQPVAGQSGASLTTEPVITIYDSNHNVDTGLTTTLSLTASGGLLADCTGLTPNAGVVDVSTCLFSGTVGSPYTLTASFTDNDSPSQFISVTSGPISPTGAGAPTRILFITPAGQPVGGTVAGSLLATQPSVQIVDSWGNVVTSSSATVTLTSPVGTTLSGCANLTAVVGVVNVTGCTFGGTVNTFYTMTASSAGLTSATSSPFKVTQAGTAASVTIGPAPSSVSASNVTDSTLTIQLVDAWQNPTTSTSATNLTLKSSSARGFFASGYGQLGPLNVTAAVTIPSGIGGSISEYYGDENAGTPTISAVLTATQAPYGSGTLTVNAQTTLDTASVVQGNSQVATVNTNFATALEVQVIDQFGNPVPNVAVTFTAPSSGASGAFSAGCTSNPYSYTCVATTNTNGDATASTFTASTTAGSFSVVASDPNVATPVTFSLQNSAGAAAKIAITTQPTTPIIAGGTESLSVSVEDIYGNLVSSADSISVALSSNSFVLGTTTVAASGGVANFSGLQITAAGTNYTITATDTHTAWTATTNSFTVNAAAPSKIAITAQPATSITAGSSASMSVSVEDTYGNVAISSDSISVALSSNNFVGGTTTVAAGGGVANFTNLPITAAGNYTITATDTHTAWTATTNSFAVIAAGASKVIWTIQPGPSTAGLAIPGTPSGTPTVTVEDTYNNPVSGAIVTMAITTGPGVFIPTPSSVTTGTSGTAAFPSLIIQAAGSYTITASVHSVPVSSPASSTFAVTAAGVHAIMVWGGSGQSAAVSTNFSSPLSAFVTDTWGNPVSGATVTFTAPATGAGGMFRATSAGLACLAAGLGSPVSSCTAPTNANGIATSLSYSANATKGTYSTTLTAGISNGATTPFTETNTIATFVILTAPQTFVTSATGPGISSGSVIVQAQDGNGNAVVQSANLNVNVAYTLVTGSYTLTSDPSPVTILAGQSSVAFTVGASASTGGGTFTIVASSSSPTYVSSAAQTETVLAQLTNADTSTIPTGTVSPTSASATFLIPITNKSGAAQSYEISNVYGLLTGESLGTITCVTNIANNSIGTISQAVTTVATRPAGVYTLDFVVLAYSGATCGTGTPASIQVDGTLTASAGSASAVAIAGGAGQFTANGTAFTNPLTVFVSDAHGNPITSGVTVTFTAPASGARGTFLAAGNGGTCLATGGMAVASCTATTNASGVASSLTFTAFSTAGNYDVAVATTPTLTGSPLSFPEDNT